jgi:hypothetical protein
MQPEGLRESSRWSERSGDHRYRMISTRTLKGCQTSLRILRHSRVAALISMLSGGLLPINRDTTNGYSRSALRVDVSGESTI